MVARLPDGITATAQTVASAIPSPAHRFTRRIAKNSDHSNRRATHRQDPEGAHEPERRNENEPGHETSRDTADRVDGHDRAHASPDAFGIDDQPQGSRKGRA